MRTPKKPQPVKVASGFQALSLNTSGAVRPIPHNTGERSKGRDVDFEWKKRRAGLSSTSRRAKRMY